MHRLGIDVGGSAIKGAIVNVTTGELITERLRIPTPQPATPDGIAGVVENIIETFSYTGPIGVSFPTVIVNNIAKTTGNIDPSWLGVDVAELFHKKTGHQYLVHNDADLAGLAEMSLGAGAGHDQGTVIMITIGTGLGSGLFHNGVLVPNIELGRIFGKDGQPIEYYAADRARKRDELSWTDWGKRFDFFLHHVVRVSSPNLFILGGGASKKWELFKDQITVDTPVVIAQFKNKAGIIGAARSVADL